MPTTVKLFASLRSRFGHEVIVDLEPPYSVSDLEAVLKRSGYWTTGARISVDLAFASGSDTVSQGAEVAVIPPVSGG